MDRVSTLKIDTDMLTVDLKRKLSVEAKWIFITMFELEQRHKERNEDPNILFDDDELMFLANIPEEKYYKAKKELLNSPLKQHRLFKKLKTQ